MKDIMHNLQVNLQVSGYHAYLFLILAGLIRWLLESHFGRSRINGDYTTWDLPVIIVSMGVE